MFGKEDIDYIADLSRIGLSEKEKEGLIFSINEIISAIDIVKDIDTSGVEAMEHITSLTNIFRNDEVNEVYDRESILSNASETRDGCFIVPKIVE